MASGAQNALARIERLAEGVMEFRELKNDHASLKHPSPARPVQASSIGHALLVIPDITSYVIHIGYTVLPSLFT